MESDAKILLPLDQLASGETKIPVAIRYAHMLHAQIVLLHVLPHHSLDPNAVLPDEARARTYLDTVAAQVQAAGVPAATLVRRGSPACIILDEADRLGASLIILGANIRPRLATLLGRGIADRVTRSASCPVLLVHPDPSIRDGGPCTLRSFTEDAARTGALTRRHLGVRTIEVARIIGSVSRAHEFGPAFERLHRQRPGSGEEQRFQRVREAAQCGVMLPPIVVLQLGFGYYVEDGHHRVVAARLNGQTEIDADVTECVPVDSGSSLALFASRTEFEHVTGLAELGAARAESYLILLRTIQQFARDQRLPELPLAARRWEQQVYRPLWGAIRARELSATFPGERTADLVARVAARRECSGLDWQQALEALTPAPAH